MQSGMPVIGGNSYEIFIIGINNGFQTDGLFARTASSHGLGKKAEWGNWLAKTW